jgi:uncharacterized membrane-anchored protein YhcB (DUF1043 family)
MELSWVPWTVAVIAVVAVIVVIIVARRRQRRDADDHQRALQAQTDEHAGALRDRSTAANAAAEETAARHAALLADLQREAHETQSRVDVLLERVRQDVGFDLVSRDHLIESCLRARIDGVVATNLAFLVQEPGAQPFVTQLDHVLVTHDDVIVIEHKRWVGVVFDNLVPSHVHPSFGVFLDEDGLTPPFVLQVKAGEDGRPAVMTRTGGGSPRTQVRSHARRLHRLLGERVDGMPFVKTAVYYSHPRVVVHVGDDTVAQSTSTRVLVGRDDLVGLLTGVARSAHRSGSPSLVDSVAPILQELGADVHGVGSYAGRWTSLPQHLQ